MEHLNLTPEQEVRLIEMAKALFPEYYSKAGGVHLMDATGIQEKAYIVFTQEKEVSIHWYEFCHNILRPKFDRHMVIPDYQHPVDSLYLVFISRFKSPRA